MDKPIVLTNSNGIKCASRASNLPDAFRNWKAYGDAQPHWGRKYKDEINPSVVTLNGDGFGVAVPLCFPGERSPFGKEKLPALTGTSRYITKNYDGVEDWEGLCNLSWNGYYYRPVPHPKKTEPLLSTAAWN